MGVLEIEARRHLPVLEDEYGLEQPGRASRGLEVTDVGLHRSDGQRILCPSCGAEHRAQRGRFDRVAHRGATAVQFDVSDLRRVDARVVVRGPQHRALCLLAGSGQAGSAAVVVDRAAFDHAVDAVAVGQGARQGLERDEHAALAPYETVGAGVEGEAPSVGRKPPEPGGGKGALRRDVQVHTTSEGERRLTAAQALAGQMNGHQRGRLARVDHHAGPVRVQEVRDPVRDDAAVKRRHRVPVDGSRAAVLLKPRVVVVDRTQEHARLRAVQGGRYDARVLQRLPGQLQHQPLLGVHGGGLARRNGEESGIEFIDPVQECAPSDLRRIGGGPAIFGHFTGRVEPIPQQLPERLRICCSRQSASQPDNCYRFDVFGTHFRH